MRRAAFGLALAATVLAGCMATAPSKVRVDMAESGLPNCRSFEWLPTQQQPASLTEQRVKNEIMSQLEKKGYAQVAEKGDCRVTYLLDIHERPANKPGVGVGVGGGSGGVGGGIGVTLPIGKRNEQAGTFMHEFGHTLGLKHGGNDHENEKPAYHSVMNYLYQFPRADVSTPWRLDYDRERSVHDDWGNITYNFRQTDSLLASVANRTVSFKEFDEPPVANVINVIPGDYNRDGTVNDLDHGTWRASFGQ